ncbi:hypothetical protein AB0B50_20460 [Streptomyces sp. NPDC041068]|uniref:hypothetical protein n=1 Tax=Streptomyces sp. NPDC041068 TaxID=3155130 RepID=UPI0033E894B6
MTLTACGQERSGPTTADSASAAADSAPTAADSTPTATGSTPSHGATRSPVGPAPGNVEPDSHDGAPHYRENNSFKFPKDMSPAGEKAAREEAARIEPVLKRLWADKVWDPKRVRAALVDLGYRTAPDGEQTLGRLTVQEMDSRFETDHYVTPEGTRIALLVRKDACVTAFTQPTNFQVSTNGPYMETGCFEPRGGH